MFYQCLVVQACGSVIHCDIMFGSASAVRYGSDEEALNGFRGFDWLERLRTCSVAGASQS